MNSDLSKTRLRFISNLGSLLNDLQGAVELKDMTLFTLCQDSIRSLIEDFLFINKSVLLEPDTDF